MGPIGSAGMVAPQSEHAAARAFRVLTRRVPLRFYFMSPSPDVPKRLARPKRRVKQHLHGEFGVSIVKSALPTHWVVRELGPDYGLDLHIETFIRVPEQEVAWDALGEHIFAQVKTVDGVRFAEISPARGVESRPHELLPPEPHEDRGSMRVVCFSLETDEIETVRQMGAAVPVLLLVVDKRTSTTFYICLNDWIAKALPRVSPDWRLQRTVTVHIPTTNVVSAEGAGWNYLSLLAKRPKFFGAFAEFAKYQEEMRLAAERIELEIGLHSEEIPDLTTVVYEYKQLFNFYYNELVDLDIWPTEEVVSLQILHDLAEHLEDLKAALDDVPDEWDEPDKRRKSYQIMHAVTSKAESVFMSLSAVPRTYGLMIRNWRLPTQLGQIVTELNDD